MTRSNPAIQDEASIVNGIDADALSATVLAGNDPGADPVESK